MTRQPPPTSISPEASVLMGWYHEGRWWEATYPPADDREAWEAARRPGIERGLANSARAVAATGVCVRHTSVGGLPAVEVLPPGGDGHPHVIVALHGSGYVMSNAAASLSGVAQVAALTGVRVLSLDYPKAPEHQWQHVHQATDAALDAVVTELGPGARWALLGISAGGGLTVSRVLHREGPQARPAALALWSPWVDLTAAGDTMTTLADADLTLTYPGGLDVAARAFAGHTDLEDPRLSPLYGDFGPAFPPTLIQEGTRTIFLSGSVRLYRSLTDHGHDATIDMYEGMPHVFQVAEVPEAVRAHDRTASFLLHHLTKDHQ
jgi:acetyl esterase/lipase